MEAVMHAIDQAELTVHGTDELTHTTMRWEVGITAAGAWQDL